MFLIIRARRVETEWVFHYNKFFLVGAHDVQFLLFSYSSMNTYSLVYCTLWNEKQSQKFYNLSTEKRKLYKCCFVAYFGKKYFFLPGAHKFEGFSLLKIDFPYEGAVLEQ